MTAPQGSQRRARLAAARLYLIADGTSAALAFEDMLATALHAGVDVFQLRDKHAGDERLLALALRARRLTAAAGALLIVNDRPDIAVAVNADGVHLGQEDMPVGEARALLGEDRLIGLSTHGPEQIEAAHALRHGPDYIGVGPVFTTPTKPGRAAVGLELVSHAAAHATLPFFAIGGLDATNIAAVIEAGARRVAVVRAIAAAADPAGATRTLREALAGAPTAAPLEAGVGAT